MKKNEITISDFLSNKNIDLILNELKLKTIEEVYAAIGIGKYTASSIIKTIYKKDEPEKDIAEKINENRTYNKQK